MTQISLSDGGSFWDMAECAARQGMSGVASTTARQGTSAVASGGAAAASVLSSAGGLDKRGVQLGGAVGSSQG
jgi:hypothetical protein